MKIAFDVKIAVLGGGLAGTAFAYEASRRGFSVTLVEKEERLGGLLRSENIDGYVFDAGGSHILFSRDQRRMRFFLGLLGNNVVRHRRDARVYFDGKYVKYPFENGLYMLSPDFRYRALRDLLNKYVKHRCGEAENVSNFEEWIYATFGETIADSYLVPYNRKLWKRDLKQISLEWVGNRVPNPPLDDLLKTAVGINTEGYLHQLNFVYPRVGGIQELVNAFESRLRKNGNVELRLGQRVDAIDHRAKTIVLSNGETLQYDRVVSSLPLPEVARIAGLRGFPHLDYNSLIVVGIGLRDTRLPRYHWVYFPDEETIFHRIAFLSNYSPFMAPRNGANIIAEITVPPSERLDPEKSVQKTIEGLEAVGLIRGDRVEVAKAWFWKYGYVVYDRNYSKNVKRARRELRDAGIMTIGRFGLWSYLNMDDVVFSSFEAARALR